MNKEILMVMRWLENSKSVSLEDLKQNEVDASAAYYGSRAAYYDSRDDPTSSAAYFARTTAYHTAFEAACAACNASECDTCHVVNYTAQAAHAVGEYFKYSKENEQDYIYHLENTNA